MGSHLVESLLKRRYKVIILANVAGSGLQLLATGLIIMEPSLLSVK